MSVAPRPRARVLMACAAAVAVAAVPLGLAGPAAAAGEALTAVVVGTPAVAVDGFGSADVAVSVEMTLASPVRSCAGQEARLAGRPWVRLTRTSGATGIRVDDVVDVPLVTPPGGDPAATAGTWSGTWKAASSRNGTWTVTGVGACTEAAPAGWSVDPRGQGISSSVTVNGTGAPRLSVAMPPTVWGARSTTVRAVVSDASGKPLTGRTVTFGKDGGCGTAADGGAAATTDSRGVATLVTRPRPVMCAYLATPAAVALRIDAEHALIVKRSVTPRFTFAAVSGFPVSAAVARGRNSRRHRQPRPEGVAAGGRDHPSSGPAAEVRPWLADRGFGGGRTVRPVHRQRPRDGARDRHLPRPRDRERRRHGADRGSPAARRRLLTGPGRPTLTPGPFPPSSVTIRGP